MAAESRRDQIAKSRKIIVLPEYACAQFRIYKIGDFQRDARRGIQRVEVAPMIGIYPPILSRVADLQERPGFSRERIAQAVAIMLLIGAALRIDERNIGDLSPS